MAAMARYKAFACPFYTYNEKNKVHCEGAVTVSFRKKPEEDAYIEAYCTSVTGWERCSIAKAKVMEYEMGGYASVED